VLKNQVFFFVQNCFTSFIAFLYLVSSDLLVAKGISLLRVADAESALETFNIILSSDPENREAIIYKTAAGNALMTKYLNEGNAFVNSGEFLKALEVYSKVNENEFVNLNSDLVYQLCNNRGVCFLNTGDQLGALDLFTSSKMMSSITDGSDPKKRGSDNALNTAIILKSLSRFEESLAAFVVCISHNPLFVTAHCGKAEVLTDLDRCEEAVAAATAGLEALQAEETGAGESSDAVVASSMCMCMIQVYVYDIGASI
jgi:tetratricopeptide (TPR) repeat protein